MAATARALTPCMPITSLSRISASLASRSRIAGGDFALDVDHLVHGVDGLIGDLGQHVDIALVAAQTAGGGGGGVMRALGGEQGDLAVGFVQLRGFLGGVADLDLHHGLARRPPSGGG